jgi:hypothetical protein
VDTGATFDTTNNGLEGVWVCLDNGSSLQYRRITSNTATALTLESAWDTNPTTNDTYYIGYIIADWRTKQYSLVKPPQEVNEAYFWLIHNKADSTQNLTLKSHHKKSNTAIGTFTIDLNDNFIDKKYTKLRSSWIHWSMRTFIYDTSTSISPPVDITSYAIRATAEEER